MRTVFPGPNAPTFPPPLPGMLGQGHEILAVPDAVEAPEDITTFRTADVLIGIRLDASHPQPDKLRLYHAPAAGVDAIDRSRLPAGAALCCCFGHEAAIAEYVMAALLLQHVPIPVADGHLRQGRWPSWASSRASLRTELGDATLGILGFGHIGQAVAARAKAFGMQVTIANRSLVATGPMVDAFFPLGRITDFMASADYVLVTLPHNAETEGLVDRTALAAMRPHGVILNVGRGPVVDEQALYDALAQNRIGGAVIDTWYVYPSPGNPNPHPGRLPFHTLGNCTLTPHMSGWTHGTIRRRQETMAENIRRLVAGQPLANTIQS